MYSIKNLLSGQQAFYKQQDYYEKTKKDLASSNLMPVVYEYNTQNNTDNKIIQFVKKIFSFILSPIHQFLGKVAFLPSSNPTKLKISPHYYNDRRKGIEVQNNEWKFKRFTVQVGKDKIDAMIVGKEATLGNGRWVLVSNGNSQFYEQYFSGKNSSNVSQDISRLVSELNGNALIFNYPGVGCSTGGPSKESMVKAYEAMLKFLEDKEKGISAKEIIGYGFSIGGGVQGTALGTHQFQPDINYVFAKRQTFSSLSKEAASMTNLPIGFLVKALGWELSSEKSSKALQYPELVIQTANIPVDQNHENLMKRPCKIIDDNVIFAKASLAEELLKDQQFSAKKYIFGVHENHQQPLKDYRYFAGKILKMLGDLSYKKANEER